VRRCRRGHTAAVAGAALLAVLEGGSDDPPDSRLQVCIAGRHHPAHHGRGGITRWTWELSNHPGAVHPNETNRATLSALEQTLCVVFWQIFWQAAAGKDSGKVFYLVGATGIEPVTSAV
jgi:hypothetical protein